MPLLPSTSGSDDTLQSGGSGEGLAPLVDFYSKLPKGNATPKVGGIKGRFFNGDNASGTPYVLAILGILGIGYTLDYHSAFPYFSLLLLTNDTCSALEYAFFSIFQAFVRLPLSQEHHKNHAH